MGEYVTTTNHFGITGISAEAIKQIAVDSANAVTAVKVNEKASSCRIYGNKIKINIIIGIDSQIDRPAKCQEVKEEIAQAIQNQLEIRLFDLRVSAK